MGKSSLPPKLGAPTAEQPTQKRIRNTSQMRKPTHTDKHGLTRETLRQCVQKLSAGLNALSPLWTAKPQKVTITPGLYVPTFYNSLSVYYP